LPTGITKCGRQLKIPRAGFLTVEQAETAWGIKDTTVSRWRTWLKDADAILERIIIGAHRKALLEPEPNRQAPDSGEEEWFTTTFAAPVLADEDAYDVAAFIVSMKRPMKAGPR
jgi:hypothetical protein